MSFQLLKSSIEGFVIQQILKFGKHAMSQKKLINLQPLLDEHQLISTNCTIYAFNSDKAVVIRFLIGYHC